jgi:DNA mismatch repair protein MutL
MARRVIKPLDRHLINRIAAGEVVAHPAAALKELIENAIDSGASAIEVQVDEAGLKRLEVVDNGCGIEFAQLPLAFERHATSKIDCEADLESIHTLGFRGEALPSIASVSHLLFESKSADEAVGGFIEFDSGQLVRHQAKGLPQGTRVSVMDLFQAVPARRKFLKSPAYEIKRIHRLLRSFCLSHHSVGFKYIQDGKQRWYYQPAATVEQRVFEVLGFPWTGQTEHVWEKQGENEATIFFTRPDVTFANSLNQYFFLNGRNINDRGLGRVVLTAYRSLLMERRFPGIVLFLTMPANQFDINVHPSKQEARLEDGRGVYRWLERLMRSHLNNLKIPTSQVSAVPMTGLLAGDSQHGSAREMRFDYGNSTVTNLPGHSYREDFPVQQQTGSKGWFQDLRIIGQLRSSYLLLEGREGLIVLDQHAAHERVLFERIRIELKTSAGLSQRLIEPVVLSGSRELIKQLVTHMATLSKAGFEIEAFGADDYIVRGAPHYIEGDIGAFIFEFLDELDAGRSQNQLTDIIDHLAERLACKAAIKFGQQLDMTKMRQLLVDLDNTPGATNCPHGRPVYYSLSDNQLASIFKRH